MKRAYGRAADELRPVRIEPGAQEFAEGSALIETGRTRVICAVTVEDRIPPFLKGLGRGWVTAEYGMLPRSTVTRNARESRAGGRTHEIQRLVGRSLRAVVDLDQLGERTFVVDCDVLQADGGTRTAAITGAYVALHQALLTLVRGNRITKMPLKHAVAATSAGIVDDQVLLDLCYEEDYRAAADFNVVITDNGEFVEVQGTAEAEPFARDRLDEVLSLTSKGIAELFDIQKEAVARL